MIRTFDKLKKPIILGLLPILCCLLTNFTALAGSGALKQDEGHGNNIRWEVKDEVIVITYDLLEDQSVSYRVDVTMKREDDGAFEVVPQTIEGDVGEGLFAGRNREIRWYFKRDFPDGFQGAGYYFELRVEKLGEDNSMLYYLIGAGAVAGGVLALLIGGGEDGSPQLGLPGPPVRP